MTERGLIIVGSGPAGVAAAGSFREHDTDTSVRLFSADIDLPYARPPLSKQYLSGQTDDVALHPTNGSTIGRSSSSSMRRSTAWTSPSAPSMSAIGTTYSTR